MKKLVLFDFDGTITIKDSLVDFVQYAVGKPVYYMGLLRLIPMLTGFKLRFIPNDIAKEKFIGYYFKDWDVKKFQNLASRYSLLHIDKIIRPKAIEKIRWHQQQGHKVVIISASIECWLKPWCDKNKIELISTKLEFKEEKITGKFATRNCYGIEKVNRVQETYPLSQYEYIYAYGDSHGDKEMLSIANERYYKKF